MRVGLSYSRCLPDIFDGKVDINDVLVIITRTDFDVDDDQHWKQIWHGYAEQYSAWSSVWRSYLPYEDEFRELTRRLVQEGKLHQPRQFGGTPPRVNHHWLDLVLTDESHEALPAVKRAWENYQLIAGLS